MTAQHVADACAAGAVCLFGASLATINEIVQIIAGILTAIAALVSVAVHVYNWRKRRLR